MIAREYLVALLLALAIPAAQAERQRLVVYTSVAPDLLQAYEQAFESDVPDIDIELLRAASGIITARVLAERDQPVADVVWGVAASNLLVLEEAGLLHPYAPVGLEHLSPAFRDQADPPSWTGMDVWTAMICFNTDEATRHGLPAPTSWRDLLDPVYRGHLTMPNPASSGTGYMMVSGWLQLMGEQAGWEFMDALHKNAVLYTHSGSKPCRLAGAGEHAVGLSYEFRAATLRDRGAPIDLIFPAEGLPWDIDASAIVSGTSRLPAARRFIDWAASRSANELYAQSWAIVAIPGVAKPQPYLPDDLEQRLLEMDMGWAASNRARILAEWRRRYEGKSEPLSD